MKEISAYEHRPMACSTLLNFDDDDLLCRHAKGAEAEVPDAGARKLKVFALSPISAAPF